MNVSIILSTYNRADKLDLTLSNFCKLDHREIEAEYIVVNNNSSDNTASVVQRYQDQLPIVYLEEPIPGKNNAMNRALDSCEMGDVIVFTDDDICPQPSWLQNICASIQAYPDFDVFGGKVSMIWPDDAPQWARELEFIVYPQHDLGDESIPYPERRTPIGPNFWVRKNVFENGRRFDNTFGPKPNANRRIMGNETSFLFGLLDEGKKIRYCPECHIGHYLSEDQLTVPYVIQRARTHGRFFARLGRSFPKRSLYERNPFAWRAIRRLSLLRHLLNYGIRAALPNSPRNIKSRVLIQREISFNIECLMYSDEIFEYQSSRAVTPLKPIKLKQPTHKS